MDYCASVNAAANNGVTALHLACVANHYGAAEKLVAAGADVDARSNTGVTPIFEAVKFCDLRIGRLLLNSGCDLTVRTRDGEFVLETVAMEPETNFLGMLREYDLRGVDFDHERVVRAACFGGHVRAVKTLLWYGSVQGLEGMALVCASEWGKTGVVQVLLGARVDPNTRNANGDTALQKACSGEHTGVVKVLLAADADVDQRSVCGTALEVALTNPVMLQLLLRAGASSTGLVLQRCLKMSFWTQECAEMLVKFGADVKAVVNDDGLPLLSWAVEEGRCAAVQFLLEHGADVHARDSVLGNTPLHLVKWCASSEKIVQALLDAKANVNARSKNDTTPLLHAVSENFAVPVLDLLVKHGADLRSHDPAAEAARRGNLENLEFLLDAKANVEARSQYSKSALHLAVYNNHTEVLLKLLERGVGINVQNYSPSNDYCGGTPLMTAAARGNCAMVHTLLAQGADLFVRDRHGESVLEMVQRYGDGVNGNSLADVRGVLFRAECEAKMVALMLGLRPGQGEGSLVRRLNEDVWKMVWAKVVRS